MEGTCDASGNSVLLVSKRDDPNVSVYTIEESLNYQGCLLQVGACMHARSTGQACLRAWRGRPVCAHYGVRVILRARLLAISARACMPARMPMHGHLCRHHEQVLTCASCCACAVPQTPFCRTIAHIPGLAIITGDGNGRVRIFTWTQPAMS